MELETLIRDVPNFPKQGIIFKDITTLLKVPEAFRFAIDAMTEHYRPRHVDVVVAIESRGFIFGAPVAYNLNAAFVPVRKLGKLPAPSVSLEYHLEYGTATLEIHKDAIVPGQRVLVVDDSLTSRELERSILEAAGYAVETAVDGVQALQRLGQQTFDAVICDVEMPRLDGFALTQAIRADARLQHLPVILVTSLERPEDRQRGLEAGAQAYITKGAFDQDTLLKTIARLAG
ncbi:MAG: adenine phosphoribosyltransferase [Chloroflexota bacterium]